MATALRFEKAQAIGDAIPAPLTERETELAMHLHDVIGREAETARERDRLAREVAALKATIRAMVDEASEVVCETREGCLTLKNGRRFMVTQSLAGDRRAMQDVWTELSSVPGTLAGIARQEAA